MSRLGSGLSRFFGRVEILARGAEPLLKGAEVSLERGDPLEARAQARALLARVPESPLGLALWADAAEGCGFPEEVVDALDQLAARAPWRQEIWLRLGRAGVAAGWEGARGALERAATGVDAPAIARQALLQLADLELGDGEPERARRWLDRVPRHGSLPDAELAVRQAECAMDAGRWEEARGWLDRVGEPSEVVLDELGGRLRLLQARAAERWPEQHVGSDSISLALGAYLLGVRGADALLVQLVAESRDAVLIARARDTVSTMEDIHQPRWKAAFALAEGRREDARAALVEAAEHGDRGAAASLIAHALRWRDMVAVSAVAAIFPELLPADVLLLRDARVALEHENPGEAAAALEAAYKLAGVAEAWAEEELTTLLGGWVGSEGATSDWERLFGELFRAARSLEQSHHIPAIEALAIERQRPLYVAILGEFNAGKSTFINALLSTDVAPTGVMPTTASLHWVAWAPDPFARVLVRGGADRVVSHDDLKRTLTELRKAGTPVERVQIYAPLERLKRIEILDTPGFNAPDTSHAEEARRGIEEAHVALWLLDATAPLKDSERRVIEEVAAAGVPTQVLVNKRDRLGPDDLERVMAYVDQALEATGIASLAPPVAFSAQLALAGRLGDGAALEQSGWLAVEEVLAEHVVNVADSLRERALRRKAARIADALAAVAEERVGREATRGAEQVARADGQRRIVGLLRGDKHALAVEIAQGLGPARALLARDMSPLEQLAEGADRDAEVMSYAIDKTCERLTPAIRSAIESALRGRDETTPLPFHPIEPALTHAIAGARAATGGLRPLSDEVVERLVQVCLTIAADVIEAETPATRGDRESLAMALRIRTLRTRLMPQKVAAPTSK